MSNEWFDKGEFPPAGTRCMFNDDGDWRVVKIVGIDSEGYCVYEQEWKENQPYNGNSMRSKYKPLKSEREETIERIAESLRQTFVGSCYAEANRLYEAGLRFKEDNQDV